MQITIIATLTPEQILILAKEQGWTETISTFDNTDPLNPVVTGSIPNPITPEECLRQVYQSIVGENATYNFIKYNERVYGNTNTDYAKIKSDVFLAITSSII